MHVTYDKIAEGASAQRARYHNGRGETAAAKLPRSMTMFRNRIVILGVSATLLLMGAAVVRAVEQPAAAQKQKQAQTPEEQRNREQAIESVKKSLAEDPKDAGLQHALQCLQSSEQCKDEAKLKHDIDSVKRCLDKDPKNEGLRHAMAYLETHHQQLETQRKEHEQAIDSVKKSLAKDPKDADLQHALQCLESSKQCKDEGKVKRDIDSVKRHLDKDPQNEGLRHAMAYLETHHQQLEMQRMEHERAMQRQGSGRPETRPETPAHPDGAEGKGR